jgi:methyl-accepting chemotaxis protein
MPFVFFHQKYIRSEGDFDVNKFRPLFRKIHDLIGLTEISIRKKFLFGFLSISIIPLIIIGIILYMFTSAELMSGAKENLKAIGAKKAEAVEDFFEECLADLVVVGEMAENIQREALYDLENFRDKTAQEVKQYLQSRITHITMMSDDPTIYRAMVAFEATTGPKGKLWKSLAEKYGPWITVQKEIHGFKNLYLVSKTGRIVYSVEERSDLGKNLKTGDFKNSPSGKAFKKGLQKATLQDFEFHKSLNNVPAGFASAPIKLGRTVVGVIMGQIDIDPINKVMHQHGGLSEKTEAYLVAKVGEKIQLRNKLETIGKNIKDYNPNIIVDRAFYGVSGIKTQFDQDGVYRFVSYAPITLPGIKWAIYISTPVEYVFTHKYPDAETDRLTHFKENEFFVNLSLISPEGFLFYSVLHEKDYHTNLLEGPYRDSHLGRFINQTSFTRKIMVSDFKKYTPSNNASTGFAGLPILKDDRLLFTVVVQIPTVIIQKIMEEPTGLGKSGETFIVGADNLRRTESRFLKEINAEQTVLNPKFKMDEDTVNQALHGTSSAKIYTNYRGKKVLSISSLATIQGPNTYNPNGVKWIIFSEMEMNEIRAPITRLAWICMAVVLTIGFIVLLMSYLLSDGFMQQINHMMHLFSKIRIGNFNARAKVVSKDELGDLTISLNALLDDTLVLRKSRQERDTMYSAVVQLLNKIKALTKGDLTVRAEVTEHLIGAIAESFNTMAQLLTEIIREANDATFRVGHISNQVNEFTARLANMSTQQSSHVDKIISVINSIKASAKKILENAAKLAILSEQSMENAKRGGQAVENTDFSMIDINEQMKNTTLVVKRLEENLQKIYNVFQSIIDTSEKTSLPSLDTSIQTSAAKKNEPQKSGYKLSSQQIENLIKIIQEDIQKAIRDLYDSIEQIFKRATSIDDAQTVLKKIESASSQIMQMAHLVSQMSEEQEILLNSTAKRITAVGEITTQTVKTSKQITLSMRILSKIADQLRALVEGFKVEKKEGPMKDKN